jgi:hypothetical protein
VALLVTETLPVTLPAVVGAKFTVKVAARPVFRIVPADTPLAVKPEPVMLTLEIVTLELPEFVSVTARLLMEPVLTLPKLRIVGLALSRYVATFTVSVAALLVAVPAVLLTTTSKVEPLSAVVVAGVV